jgi:hypothetical protein
MHPRRGDDSRRAVVNPRRYAGSRRSRRRLRNTPGTTWSLGCRNQGPVSIYRIAMVPFAGAFLLALGVAPLPAFAAGQAGVARPATSGRSDVRLLDLAAVRRLVNALARQGSRMTEGARAAARADFSLVSQAVIGDSPGRPIRSRRADTSGDEWRRATPSGHPRRRHA